MQITVFTIVYNNYGRFIPAWIEYLNNQTVVPKILIVLGKDHGADLKYLADNGINYIYYDSDNMGKLRNVGLDFITTDWWLYFSVDDELLPHTCEEIINSGADAVSLLFDVVNVDGTIEYNCKSPIINIEADLKNWKQFRWGGYVAVKDKTIRFNEEVEIPNLLLHFELFKKGLLTVQSKDICAVCHRWEKSHGLRNVKTGMNINMADILNAEVKKILCK